MKMRTTLVSLFVGACVAAAMAQHPVDVQQQRLQANHHIGYFGDGEADSVAVYDLINRFYVDQFRHVHDPRAPYFMLMSRNANMAMGIGGTIQAVASYDWHGPISGSNFSPYEIPIQVNPASPNLFQTSIGQTSLFFTMFGRSSRLGNYKFYLSAKFKEVNGSNVFKLDKAYATVGDWTLGYATSTFSDPSSQPYTIETQGPNSEIDNTRMLVRYMHEFKKKWTMAVAVEAPNDQIAPATAQYEGGSVYIPNFAAFVQYGSAAQHIRLSGILKGLRYRDLVKQKNNYVTAWGLNLTTVFRPVSPVTVYAAANYGRGIGSLVNDLACGQNDLLGLVSEPGKMYAPHSYGWYVAGQYNFRPNLYSTLVFSQERLLPKHNSSNSGDQYKYGLYGAANIIWEITPRCTVGAEFDLGKRANVDGSHNNDYRANLMAKFSF